MKSNVIHLDEGLHFASGAYCHCNQHAENVDQCIKISTGNEKSENRIRSDVKYKHKLHASVVFRSISRLMR